MALADNLVAYWSLDEASGNAIDAHSTYDLTETSGTIAATTGKVSGCRDFEEADSEYFTIADNADLSVGDIDFSWACWVQLEAAVGTRWIISKRGGPDTSIEYDMLTDGNRFKFRVANGATTGVATADNLGAPSTGTWYFVVGWHDSVNNVVGICVNDGTPNTTSYSSGSQNGTAALLFGATSAVFNWDGLIDEVGFWKKVLSASEITELYNAGAGRDYAYITGGGGGGTTPKNVFGKMLSGPFGGAI